MEANLTSAPENPALASKSSRRPAFRKLIFWIHLTAGSLAGIVILVMSITGVLLAYRRQILAWADGGLAHPPVVQGATRLPVEALLGKVVDAGHGLPSGFTLHREPGLPAEAAFGRERTILVNPYTGAILGEGSRAARSFFQQVEQWHRWLAMAGGFRNAGRAITGAANLIFLLLVVSGFYLWWPRQWSWRRVRAVTVFRGGLAGRARDWNWHNVIGFWCAVPLFFIVLTGVVMSYPWANALLYKLSGSEPPARLGEGERGGGERPGRRPAEAKLDGLNAVWAEAERQAGRWQTITMRLPGSPRGPVMFQIDEGNGGRPDLRSQLVFERRTGHLVRREIFSEYSRGRQLRMWGRFVHTGEAGGALGQTLAAIASAGGAVLVWTGLGMAWRRYRGWQARRSSATQTTETEGERA